jgi:hypothetical protein
MKEAGESSVMGKFTIFEDSEPNYPPATGFRPNPTQRLFFTSMKKRALIV